jgi:hypothetical protein
MKTKTITLNEKDLDFLNNMRGAFLVKIEEEKELLAGIVDEVAKAPHKLGDEHIRWINRRHQRQESIVEGLQDLYSKLYSESKEVKKDKCCSEITKDEYEAELEWVDGDPLTSETWKCKVCDKEWEVPCHIQREWDDITYNHNQ